MINATIKTTSKRKAVLPTTDLMVPIDGTAILAAFEVSGATPLPAATGGIGVGNTTGAATNAGAAVTGAGAISVAGAAGSVIAMVGAAGTATFSTGAPILAPPSMACRATASTFKESMHFFRRSTLKKFVHPQTTQSDPNTMSKTLVRVDPKIDLPNNKNRRKSKVTERYTLLKRDQLERMCENEVTAIIMTDAQKILEVKPSKGIVVPFVEGGANLDANKIACALTEEVPAEIYKQENVWTTMEGSIEFSPWVWRFALTPATNAFVTNYNKINDGDPEFPADAFRTQKRTLKNRIYKQKSRKNKERKRKR